MDQFLDTLMNALAVGSLYALIALGYTMVYGILKFINFAHSDIFVLGAWVSYAAALVAGIKNPAAPAPVAQWVMIAAFSILTLGLLLIAYEKLLMPMAPESMQRRLPRIRTGRVTVMVGAWALAIVGLVYLARAVYGIESIRIFAGGIILVVAMLTCGLVGFVLERLAYKPLRKAPRLNVLITAIGVSLLLQNVGQTPWMFGTKPEGMPALLPDIVLNETVVQTGTLRASPGSDVLRLDDDIVLEDNRSYRLDIVGADGAKWDAAITADMGGYPANTDVPVRSQRSVPVAGGETYKLVRGPVVPIRLVDVVGVATAIGLMLVLDWLVFRTKLGRAMRAVSHNPSTASLMGIPVDLVISFTFVLGAMLAAAAGFLYPQRVPLINQTAAPAWVLLGLKAFVAAVVGGIGNIRGAMVGGLLIGLLEFFGKTYVSTALVDVYVFGLLIVVLLFKPSGLFGKTMREKV